MATRDPETPRKPRPFRWTSAHLTRMPDDGNRYEVLDGALLVTPQANPSHQTVAARLVVALSSYCEHHLSATAVGPGAVVWDNNELQPDVQVIPERISLSDGLDWRSLPVPLLAVEILSPGSRRHDLHAKREAYLRLGIPEYWVVDYEAKYVDVFRAGSDSATRIADTLRWAPTPGIAALQIELEELFR